MQMVELPQFMKEPLPLSIERIQSATDCHPTLHELKLLALLLTISPRHELAHERSGRLCRRNSRQIHYFKREAIGL